MTSVPLGPDTTALRQLAEKAHAGRYALGDPGWTDRLAFDRYMSAEIVLRLLDALDRARVDAEALADELREHVGDHFDCSAAVLAAHSALVEGTPQP